MFLVIKHETKELYRIAVLDTPHNLFQDWNVAKQFNMTLNDYIRQIMNFGAHPEVENVPQKEWNRYQLWFDTEETATQVGDSFDAMSLMRFMKNRSYIKQLNEDI